jgi:hypothetical protein
MGCTPYTAPSITTPTGTSGGLALNELQANQSPPVPPAFVPMNDDFTVITNNNGAVTQSLAKTNLYRAGVGQPQAATAADASGTTYCQQYAASALFIAQNQALFTGTTSPAPAVANNLFTFLANRFATSFGPGTSLNRSLAYLRALLTLKSSILGMLNDLQCQHHQPCPTNSEWKLCCCGGEDQHDTFPGTVADPLEKILHILFV